MSILKYKALNDSNKLVTGVLTQDSSLINLDEQLSEQGLRLISYELLKTNPYKKLTSQQLCNMWMSLRHYLLAGFTLVNALHHLVNNTQDQRLQALLQKIYDQMCQGKKFSAVLEPYIAKDNIILPLLQTAEKTGDYLDVLSDLESHAQWTQKFYADIRNVLTYPVIVFGALWVSMFCILYFFAPQLEGYLNDLKTPIPAFTALLLSISGVATAWPIVWILSPLGVFLLFKSVFKLFSGAGNVALYVPAVRQVAYKYHYVVISKNLYLYLVHGYTIVSALELLQKRYQNPSLKGILGNIAASVTKGVSVSSAFKQHKRFFSPFFLQMVEVGEHSNTLAENFKVISLYYEQALKRQVEALTKILEPLILLLMGGVLVAVIVGLFYPLYSQIGDGFGRGGL